MSENRKLPIYDSESQICKALQDENRLILKAPTGSGKSTQLPQILIDEKICQEGEIIILQPRRIAARMLAQRVADERSSKLGEEVGYQIRFENRTSKQTRIKFVTEAILLRRIVSDPDLNGISAIVFDEFHERHLHGDITLARVLQIQKTKRPDIKVIVMSATLDSDELQTFLDPVQVVSSEGRMFPVSIDYWKKSIGPNSTPVWDAATEAFEKWRLDGHKGDVLIFMPGHFEIQKTIQSLQTSEAADDYFILPLHGELPPDQQDVAVSPLEKPKVIVSTNVAETSLTIDGIELVIDSGLARIANYDSSRGINTLHIHQVSRSSSDQRAGRAGRTKPGHCIRLWKESDHGHRLSQEIPEIHRLDLSETLLNLKCSGVDDLKNFPWFDKPSNENIDKAIQLLQDLGAFNNDLGLTIIGKKMQAFPTHPRYSRLLLAASEFDCVNQACLIAGMMQGREILLSRVDRRTQERRDDILGSDVSSDLFLMMRAWRYASAKRFNGRECKQLGIHGQTARQVKPLFDQFLRIAEKEGLDTKPQRVSDENIRRCILLAFSDRLAKKLDRGTMRCEMVHQRRGELTRSSAVDSDGLFIAAEVNEIEGREKQVNTILSNITLIEEDWLIQHFPNDWKQSSNVILEPETKKVHATQRTMFRDLVISEKLGGEMSLELAAEILAEQIVLGKIPLRKWDAHVELWIRRVNALSKYCPDLMIPPIDSEAQKAIIIQIIHGSTSAKDLKDKEVIHHLRSWLSNDQNELLEKFAPEKISLSNGKKVRVNYSDKSDPTVSARIQDLLGVVELPQILMGKSNVKIEILAPNFRPVQITGDLKNFWLNQYPDRKKELQRKYPKHAWPENPLSKK